MEASSSQLNILDRDPDYYVPPPGVEPKATWWVQATPGTTYWRCLVPARYLPGQATNLTVYDVEVQKGKSIFPRQKGVAIWQFPGNITRAVLMSEMVNMGHKVFVEVDDNYLMLPPSIPGVRSEWKLRADPHNQEVASKEAHRKIIPWVHGVICSTETLAKAYRPINPNVFVCPNSVDTNDWEEPEKPDDGVLRIGYAASTSHWHDMRLIENAMDWASRQPDVEVVLLGLAPPTPTWDRINPTRIPWTESLKEYRKSLQQIDVGLCPLRQSAWSDCKSDVKAMEYAMAGAMSIVSRVEPYKPWHDGLALVCEREKDWLKAVKKVVADRDMVKKMAKDARDYVLSERTIEKNIWRWAEVASSG